MKNNNFNNCYYIFDGDNNDQNYQKMMTKKCANASRHWNQPYLKVLLQIRK